MQEFLLKENVLTDNILSLADDGKIFKGGYVAIIKEYVYQNPWSDREVIKRFRNKGTLIKYLDKNYPKFEFYE